MVAKDEVHRPVDQAGDLAQVRLDRLGSADIAGEQQELRRGSDQVSIEGTPGFLSRGVEVNVRRPGDIHHTYLLRTLECTPCRADPTRSKSLEITEQHRRCRRGYRRSV